MNVRRLAYRALRMVYKRRRIPQSDIESTLSRLDGRDRAFFKEMVWGTLRRTVYLDWVIDSHLRNPQIPPSVRVALRMGAYQILFMDSVPDYASVSETVRLINNTSFRRLVNAVLRRISRSGRVEPEETHLRFSHPKWISDLLIESYGEDNAILMMENHMLPAPVVLRVNLLKTTRESLLDEMRSLGLRVEPTEHSPQGLILEYNGSLKDLRPFEEGKFTVQSQSSQLVSLLFDPKPGEMILDMCAAPGGKTGHIAELMKDRGKIFALDVSPDRIEVLRESVERLGLRSIETILMDAREAPRFFEEKFDRVLLDVPCTSLATVRKNPDVLLRVKPEDVKRLSNLQRELLEAGWKVLKDGGIMLYGTCTLTPQENTENVRWFVENHDVEVVDLRSRLEPFGVDGIWDEYGFLILPDEETTEFYVSVLRKVRR